MAEAFVSPVLRDTTLREGLETPGAKLSEEEKLVVFGQLRDLGIASFELVAPVDSEAGIALLSCLDTGQAAVRSGIVPILVPDRHSRIVRLVEAGANRVDLLLHVSEVRLRRGGFSDVNPGTEEIADRFHQAVEEADGAGCQHIGIGLGDAFRARPDMLYSVVKSLCARHTGPCVLYDTVGVALPMQVSELVGTLTQTTQAEVQCHFHNDLGMATANTVVAIASGASGADVSVGGLGDRSGNACLEEVAVILEKRLGRETGIQLTKLTEVSRKIMDFFGVHERRFRPVVGEFAFVHSTPSHYGPVVDGSADAYEPFPPEVVGQTRRFQIDGSAELATAVRGLCRNGSSPTVDLDVVLRHKSGQLLTEEQLWELLR